MNHTDMIQDAGSFMVQYIQSDKYKELLLTEIKDNANATGEINGKISNLSDELPIWWTPDQIADAIIAQRLTNIQIAKIHFVSVPLKKRTFIWRTIRDSLSGEKGRESQEQDMEFEQESFTNKKNQEMAVHEFTHVSTSWNHHIIPWTFFKLESAAKANDPYYSKATEIHARMTAVKYMLRKTKICNPLKEEITEAHIDELLKYDFMQRMADGDIDNALLDLLNDSKIEKQKLVELMNEIASTDGNSKYIEEIKSIA